MKRWPEPLARSRCSLEVGEQPYEAYKDLCEKRPDVLFLANTVGQAYRRGQYDVHVHIRRRARTEPYADDFCAVFKRERAPLHHTRVEILDVHGLPGSADSHVADLTGNTQNRDNSVLVQDVQFVEEQQGMIDYIPRSVVRLTRLNDCSMFGAQSPDVVQPSTLGRCSVLLGVSVPGEDRGVQSWNLGGVVEFMREDGKLCPCVWCTLRQDRKGLDQVIQHGTHVVNGVTYKESPPLYWWVCKQPQSEDVLSRCGIEVSNHVVYLAWRRVQESPDFSFELREVLICSRQLAVTAREGGTHAA